MEMMDFNTIQKNDSKPKYLKINSRDLMIPDHAQRKFNQRHGDKLAAEWTVEKFKPLDVSFRDGKYWVIDGQHRLYAMKKRKGGDCTILCYVHYGMTAKDEADFFLDQLKNTKVISTIDRMRIRFMIGDETVIGMVRGAEKAGFAINFETNQAQYRIICLAALEKVYNALSYQAYVDMLACLKKAYNGRPDSISREMLLGMGLFYNMYYKQFDNNVLANALKANATPMDIIIEGRTSASMRGGNTHGIQSLGRSYARAILRVYNCRRKKNVLEDRF